MDREKTARYYAGLTSADLCDCPACRLYRARVREQLPLLAAWLDERGVEIEKPLETMPLEPFAGRRTYVGTQYVVLGAPSSFSPALVEGVSVILAESHPCTEVQETHFVLELEELSLRL